MNLCRFSCCHGNQQPFFNYIHTYTVCAYMLWYIFQDSPIFGLYKHHFFVTILDSCTKTWGFSLKMNITMETVYIANSFHGNQTYNQDLLWGHCNVYTQWPRNPYRNYYHFPHVYQIYWYGHFVNLGYIARLLW